MTAATTSSPAAFLLARLEEDEAAALAAVSAGSPRWERVYGGKVEVRDAEREAEVFDYTICFDEGSPSKAQAEHIARHDPARVRAQVAALRAVVELHPDNGFGDFCMSCCDSDDPDVQADYPCDTLLALCQPYADHPDFDPAWLAS